MRVPSTPCAAAAAIPEPPAQPVARPSRGPPAAADSPETTLRLAEDHDRIAERLNDIVVRRIFSAGLDLEATRSLIGEHCAAAKIQHAISELDLAIRDIRDVVFDRHRPGSRTADEPEYRGSSDVLTPPLPSRNPPRLRDG